MVRIVIFFYFQHEDSQTLEQAAQGGNRAT